MGNNDSSPYLENLSSDNSDLKVNFHKALNGSLS